MWPNLISYVCLAALLFVLKELLTTALRNRLAHQFFMKHSPNLPVVPNAGIFGGHVNQIIWARQNWRIIGDLHKRFGKTFGMFHCDKPVVSTIDLDLIKAIIFDKPNDHVNRMKFNTPLEEIEKDCILTSDEKEWRRMRKLIAPAFTKTKIMMPNVQSDMAAVIDKLIGSFERQLDRARVEQSREFITLDFEDTSLRYASALVLTCFYKQDNVVDFEAETDHFTRIIKIAFANGINPAVKFCIMFPVFIPVVNLLLQLHPIGQMRGQLIAFIKQQTLSNLRAKQQMSMARQEFCGGDTKLAHNFNPDDFILNDGTRFRRNMIDYVIDRFHDKRFHHKEYLNSTFFLFLAACKTSADAISKLFYNLAAHQEEQKKLRDAIGAEGIDSDYLVWSIYESLRLFPSGPIGCSRRISYNMKTSEGVTIPAGTLVYTPPDLIHRLKEYWGPDADEYKPERWRRSASFHPAQFIGFGAGKRGCLGGHFATAELKMLVSKLLSRYSFQLAPGTDATTIMEFDTYLIYTQARLPTNIEISRLQQPILQV